ncbi:MAG TPA: thiamine pyrophosphate-binding protein [Geminicoccaceae bacterium]|nr:thiamine pyrophosphate-binding protein [Geminicoccaceae bacterium]
MNEPNGAEALVRLLELQGVRHVFGLCGDTSLPFYDAFQRLAPGIEHILTRDERHAAYMADTYARLTGRPGICEGPSGGGATYILPGVVEAQETAVPLLAITSDIATTSRGRFALTELDQVSLFRPLTKWNVTLDQAPRLPAMLRRAFREMTSGRPGAVHLALPFDTQKAPVPAAELYGDAAFTAVPASRPAADPAAVEALAKALAAAERPMAICGGGVLTSGAEAALAALAERLNLTVATTITGKGSIGDDHPLALGVVGSNGGTAETRRLVDEADLILFIGARAGSVTTERWRHPQPGKALIAHVDVDPAVLGASYQTAHSVAGDARTVLEALLSALGDRPVRAADPRSAIAGAKAEKFARFEELAGSDERPIRPEVLVAAAQAALPADGVIVADPGTPCPYFSAYWRQQGAGRRFISNRAHGALGYALPASIGAAFARPGAAVLSVMGDGSFAMAQGELETALRLQVPVTFVVIANSSFGWIKAGQKSGFGGRYFSVDFSPCPAAAIARAMGLDAVRVEAPGELEPALRSGLRSGRPNLIEVVAQPLEEAAAPVSEWVA